MTINIFVLKGDLNGENRSDAFLFLSGILNCHINKIRSVPLCVASVLDRSSWSRYGTLFT